MNRLGHSSHSFGIEGICAFNSIMRTQLCHFILNSSLNFLWTRSMTSMIFCFDFLSLFTTTVCRSDADTYLLDLLKFIATAPCGRGLGLRPGNLYLAADRIACQQQKICKKPRRKRQMQRKTKRISDQIGGCRVERSAPAISGCSDRCRQNKTRTRSADARLRSAPMQLGSGLNCSLTRKNADQQCPVPAPRSAVRLRKSPDPSNGEGPHRIKRDHPAGELKTTHRFY